MTTSVSFPALKSALIAAASAAAVLTAGIMVPVMEIYLRNRGEFALTSSAALSYGVTAAAVVFTAGLLIQLPFLKWKYGSIIYAGWMGFGVSLMLQYSLWNDFFPALNVSASEGGGYVYFLRIWHCVFLLIPIGAAIGLHNFCFRYAGKLALIIVFSRVIPLLIPVGGSEAPEYGFFHYTLDERNQFLFANRKNVIFLVVDGMGECMFKQILQENPDLQESLKDFNCFDRMVSPLPRTMYAVPAMLTGVAYSSAQAQLQEGVEHSRYLERACHSETSILRRLKAAGFRVEGYPFILQTISYSPDLLDNSKPITPEVHQQSVIKIIDLCVFRLIPSFLHALFLDRYLAVTDRFVAPYDGAVKTGSGEHHDMTFHRRLSNEAGKGAFECGFKYFHLHGAHMPIVLDENLKPADSTSVKQQLRGALRNVELLVQKLKELELYDDAVIVVTGDHSEHYTPEVAPLIKRSQERHERLVFNSIACEVTDLARTVLAASGILETPGKSLFDRPAIYGGGQIRSSARPETLRAGNWRSTVDIPPDLRNLHSRHFQLDGRLLSLAVFEYSDTIPAFYFLVESLDSHLAWRTDAVKCGKITAYWESELPDLANGVYRVYLAGINAGEGAEHTTDFFCLPHYLCVNGGIYTMNKDNPSITAGTLSLGEELLFRAMTPYPSLIVSPDIEFSRDSLILSEHSTLGVRLPKTDKPLRLVLDFTVQSLNPYKLEFIHENTLLQCIPIERFSPMSCTLDLPQSAVEKGILNLKIKEIPRYQNREGGESQARLHLTSLRLE